MNKGTIVVGDLHGDWASLNRLINKKKPKTVICCGDFGWWPAMEVKKPILYNQKSPWKLHGIKTQGAKVYWCDGNHEDHWNLKHLTGGSKEPLEVYKDVTYMPRGSTLDLEDGRRALFFGGAESIDKDQRTLGIDWFPEEIPNHLEFNRAFAITDPIDILISHTCPLGMYPRKYSSEGKLQDRTPNMLYLLVESHRIPLVYHGHWHSYDDRVFSPDHLLERLETRVISLDYPRHGGTWWRWLNS